MPRTLEALQAEVLQLPPADRARLLDCLIASLDADVETESAWDQLADQREHEIETDAVQTESLANVLARLEARFSR